MCSHFPVVAAAHRGIFIPIWEDQNYSPVAGKPSVPAHVCSLHTPTLLMSNSPFGKHHFDTLQLIHQLIDYLNLVSEDLQDLIGSITHLKIIIPILQPLPLPTPFIIAYLNKLQQVYSKLFPPIHKIFFWLTSGLLLLKEPMHRPQDYWIILHYFQSSKDLLCHAILAHRHLAAVENAIHIITTTQNHVIPFIPTEDLTNQIMEVSTRVGHKLRQLETLAREILPPHSLSI
jgi:hypothetical protein